MPPQKSIWIIVLLLAVNHMEAQQAIFKTYTIQDGLVANQVRKVTQDAEGFIWIATWEGLSKYDGYRFTNYHTGNGLSFDVVNDIYVDKSNTIYAAENNGSIDVIINNKLSTSLSDSITINRFIESGNTVYAITDHHGIATFDNGILHQTSDQYIESVQDFARVDDTLFLILNANYKAVLLDGNFKPFSYDHSETVYQSIAVDSKKNIWICGHDELKLLDPVQERNTPIRFLPLPERFRHPFLRGADIYNLFEDIDGNYWISTMRGLIRFSVDGRVQLFNTSNGLPTNLVTDLYQDREKNIWSCSQLGVVKLVMQNDFQFFTGIDGYGIRRIYNLTPEKENDFYFHNTSQIFLMKTVASSVLPYGPTGEYNFIVRHRHKPGLLTISSGQLGELNEKNQTVNRFSSPPDTGFIQAEPDDRNNIFIGSFNGIYVKYANNDIKHFALNHRITSLMYDDEGFLWAGTWQSGLFRIRINYLEGRIENSIEDMTPVIKNLDIRSLFKDSKGNYWIGTRYDGVIRMKQEADHHWTLYRYNKTNGLSSNWIISLAEDKRGNIWVGTHSGLNKLVRENIGYRIFNFNRLNSFFGEIYSIYAASDDNIWCGGFSGLVRFHDDHIDTIAASPVVITAALAGNNELNLHTIAPVLEYKARNITFEFSSPTFLNESGILYSYRLCCIDDTSWSHPQNRHTISYSNLEPGEYSFEVRAYGWNNEPGEITSYAFMISPPFWKTWWFILSIGALILLMMLAVHQYRVQQLFKWQEARNRIATDLHDEIGSSLTNIGILSELSSKHLKQPEGVEKYLQRISEEVQGSAQAIDDIIWSVNSHNDTLENTLARMRRFTAELFDSSDTKYHLQLDEETKIHKLNMDQRRDLFLMYKEILNNIYKHAHADEVWINVHLMNNVLRLNIRDNGKGFLVNSAPHRNGLKNIYHRTSKWKGNIFLDSKEGKGTVIDIRIPLKV